MIEEHVIKLAELQAELRAEEDESNGDEIVIKLNMAITDLEKQLVAAKVALSNELIYYDAAVERISREIKETEMQIIDEWTGENKTMVFDAGTLKFRTSQSLTFIDETLVLTGLLDHTSVKDVATNYITGFNKTAVKKYMGVLDLPMGATKIEYKTTVKLEDVGHHQNSFSPQKPPKNG